MLIAGSSNLTQVVDSKMIGRMWTPTGAITSNSFIFVFMNAIFLFVGAKLRQNKDNTKLFKIYFML